MPKYTALQQARSDFELAKGALALAEVHLAMLEHNGEPFDQTRIDGLLYWLGSAQGWCSFTARSLGLKIP